ncbi:MAG: response regulator [Candidatus Pacebacteria bacterium]|jgi:DNA-binding response OmpR family regulator|nr:response regulator [Candidatus Paceibacterota bacterium]|tara:strand:+ start:1348 stop:1716 length:369 start_codon:yes stop_codon:yes gene_type:complete
MSKILIVEDDNFLLEMLIKESKKEGFDIEISTDGEDALKKIKSDSFDVVLLDLILPKLHGLDLLEKTKDITNAPPIIVVSNLYDKESIDKATSLGAKDYIIKVQSTPENIIKKVKTFLAEKD